MFLYVKGIFVILMKIVTPKILGSDDDVIIPIF